MSRTVGSLLVALGFSHKEADASIKRFEKNLRESGKRMESIGRTMSIGFTAPFILGMRQAIKAYDEEAKVVKTLEVALGRTSTALLAQAAAIQKTTVYADDAVIKVQAYAAALGHSEAQVGKMTTAAVGLAAGLGIGLDQAMSMLHKSTLGASKGLGQLVPGVKELTKEQLKSGAAIDLVTAKFSGYAEAMGNTGLGAMQKFQNQFGDLMEQFGEAALPALNKIIEKFSSLVKWFQELTPETKEWMVEMGALVALSGPVLLLAGNMIKLAASFKALGVSMAWMSNPYVAGALIALAGGKVMDNALFKDDKGNRIVKTDQGGRKYTQSFGAEMALGVEGRQYIPTDSRSSLFGQNPGLIPGFGMSFPSNEELAGGGKIIELDTTQPLDKTIEKAERAGLSMREAVMKLGAMLPSVGTKMNLSKLDALNSAPQWNADVTESDNVTMAGFGDGAAGFRIPEGFGGTDGSTMLDGQLQSVEALNEGYVMLGNTLAGVMTTMAASLAEGGNAFAAFGKAALLAAASVAKAALVESLASATKKGAAVAGAPGIIIGAIAGLAAISIVEGMIGKMKTPKLAQGAVTQGITTAIIGDNPSGKEMVLPFERNDEFAASIARKMGGGGGNLSMTVHGDKLLVFLSKRQDEARRRSSGNTINF